jgi:ketosteroid isomerase-like protein
MKHDLMPAYSPSELHGRFRDAFNLGDVEALVALHEPDAVFLVEGLLHRAAVPLAYREERF